MSLNSDQEMDKHIEVIEEEEEAKQVGERRTQYVRNGEQKPKEEQEQERHTISDAPSPPIRVMTITHSSPRYQKPSTPPLDCSSPSSLSSHQSFHEYELNHPSTAPLKTSPPAMANRVVQADPVVGTMANPVAQKGFISVGDVEAGTNNRGGGDQRKRPNSSISRWKMTESMVEKALLGLRISGFVFCLISFSVMAADKAQGWALDSFYHYKEFSYCMAVNVIGFAYSGLQVCDLVHHFTTGKHLVRHHHRHYFYFSIDQMLAYLLLSASSSAATRVYDWKSNWGEDKFPEMASASVGFSFVAFLAFASSSLISGYTIIPLLYQ